MQTETRTYGRPQVTGGLLLVFAPKQFFAELSVKPSRAWRHLLFVSLAAAALYYFSVVGWNNWFAAIVFFLNAVGMTCIYAGAVFVFANNIFSRPCSFGQVLSICVYASLGPLLLSWIPGAIWISEPWKWWTSAVGLSACIPAGLGKSAMVVGFALATIYILFRIVLFIV